MSRIKPKLWATPSLLCFLAPTSLSLVWFFCNRMRLNRVELKLGCGSLLSSSLRECEIDYPLNCVETEEETWLDFGLVRARSNSQGKEWVGCNECILYILIEITCLWIHHKIAQKRETISSIQVCNPSQDKACPVPESIGHGTPVGGTVHPIARPEQAPA